MKKPEITFSQSYRPTWIKKNFLDRLKIPEKNILSTIITNNDFDFKDAKCFDGLNSVILNCKKNIAASEKVRKQKNHYIQFSA